ncbi:dehydrodolichyl diphosphate synthase complex subunit NUS1 isoform X1 [Cinnamomum micranthum f. kanehirae]|uniref:ditrans,polycis-polyprenyl diphosphate synthase [(2E,6E)-farnesyldiphosphate specific] n=1 Tax=Cinnamomum micranthum f. kanehirae TaxID=337451 RepID=A0A443N049_9MAGN|nr:dehydrodolichyl diphosphate synthase complex subunit NUS1 isoform X1 [Cinnamomum micranthum f. kanehirae]
MRGEEWVTFCFLPPILFPSNSYWCLSLNYLLLWVLNVSCVLFFFNLFGEESGCSPQKVMETQLKESIYKNLRRKLSRALILPAQSSWRLDIWRLVIGLCWFLLHQGVNTVHLMMGIKQVLESYFVPSGLLDKYKDLQLKELHYLAVVVDNEEALQTLSIIKLLRWLSAIGVKHVCLYDMEGVLKKNKETLLESVNNSRLWEESDEKATFLDGGKMTLEFLSVSDGKEGISKAASFLCSKYMTAKTLDGNPNERVFTESDMDIALKAVGCGGPAPDLLLIYGPARCHLGFPPWRMRYTELVHMGTLKSMKYGAVVKAILKFLTVRRNYGK